MSALNMKFSENVATTVVDFDLPDSGTGTLTDASGAAASTWVDMSGYHRLVAYYFPTIATGKIQSLTLQGGTAAAGTGRTSIINDGSSTPTALTGYSMVECSHDDLVVAGETLRYVGVEVSLSIGTDEGRVVILRFGARNKDVGLSANTRDTV